MIFSCCKGGMSVWTDKYPEDQRDWNIVYGISRTIGRGALLCFASGSVEDGPTNPSPSAPSNQHFSSSGLLFSSLCPCLLVPCLNLSPSPLRSGAVCPDCCCRPTVLRSCLPSGHLAPHHSVGDFELTVAPGKGKTGRGTKWVMG